MGEQQSQGAATKDVSGGAAPVGGVDVLAVLRARIADGEMFAPDAEGRSSIAAVELLVKAAQSALQREEFKQGPDAGNDALVRNLRAALAAIARANGAAS